MVQITHARIKKGDEWETISARHHERHKKDFAKTDCYCPDDACPAKLTHYKEHEHTYYDQESLQAFTLKIAPHYKRHVGSPEHAPNCTAVKHYVAYQGYARDLGALSVGEGAFVINLNIMTDTVPAPLRQNAAILQRPFNASGRRSQDSGHPDAQEPKRLSIGLSETSALAQLIERTEFNPEHRKNILMRRHGQTRRLTEIFYDDPVALFRKKLEEQRAGITNAPAAVEFRPIPIPKFHSRRNWSIQGQAVPIISNDGEKYYASMMLHCASEAMFREMQELIKGKQGARSFLVFSERVYVDGLEVKQKLLDIKAGRQEDTAVFVHLHVSRPEQIHVWNRTPDEPKMDMGLVTMVRPPKEIPPELLKS
jgi:hypothetical protein